MKRKNIFKSLLAAAMALIMIFGAAPLSGFVGIRLPMLSLKAEAATTEDGLFEYAVDRRWTGSEYEYGVRITRCDKNVSGKVVIPEAIEGYEVKWISSYAFSSCKNITEITIPDSVTKIGEGAFKNCKLLSKVILPKNLNVIGAQIFFGCSSLESIIIPEGVTEIGACSESGDSMCDGAAFYGCTSLKEIDIPDSVTNIGTHAFYGCTLLSKVRLSDSLREIDPFAFSGCISLTEIAIPDSVTEIGFYAFSDCTSLAEIVIPDSVTEIGESAFSGCTSLSKVKLSNNLTRIDQETFSGCTSLAEIEIPDSVTSIGGSAFAGCTSLSKVKLSNNLTTINGFSDCVSLKEITIPNSVTEIGAAAFEKCTSLTEIDIPDSVTNISVRVFFGCTSLSKVKLSNNLTEIGSEAFSGCTSLKEIIIPDSVTKIGAGIYDTPRGYVFSNCTSLESITIGSGIENLGNGWIDSCRRLANIIVSPENKTYSSVDGVLFNKDKSELLAYPIGNKRSSYTIPDGVEKIGKKAFYGCRYIETLTIPASVKEIEDSALGNCYDIRTINYLGTREQWKEVVIGADNYMFALVNVRCADDSQCRHVWGEWEVVEEATYEKDGLERRVCSLCKAEQTRKIPRLGAVKVDAIELSESEKTVFVGDTFTITATVKPEDAFNRTVTWSSSDPSIATVDENGTVTAIAEGEAIITAESADGVTAECKVTVEKKESFGKKLLNVITAPFRAIINLFKKLLGK